MWSPSRVIKLVSQEKYKLWTHQKTNSPQEPSTFQQNIHIYLVSFHSAKLVAKRRQDVVEIDATSAKGLL